MSLKELELNSPVSEPSVHEIVLLDKHTTSRCLPNGPRMGGALGLGAGARQSPSVPR